MKRLQTWQIKGMIGYLVLWAFSMNFADQLLHDGFLAMAKVAVAVFGSGVIGFVELTVPKTISDTAQILGHGWISRLLSGANLALVIGFALFLTVMDVAGYFSVAGTITLIVGRWAFNLTVAPGIEYLEWKWRKEHENKISA